MKAPTSVRSPLRLGLLASIVLAAFLVTASLAAGAAPTSAGSLSGLPAESSLLFTVNAKEGAIAPAAKSRGGDRYGLTLTGVSPTAIWFADRPRRDAGRLTTPRLFGGWGRLGFRSDPPNAALVADAGGHTHTMAVELKLRRYDAGDRTARFDVRALGSLGGGLRHLNQSLESRLPSHFKAPTLFIDNGRYEQMCTLGETQLMTISPAYKAAIPGMTPAEGQLLKLQENPNLFSLYGTRFGGDGVTDFALPKMAAPPGTTWFVCTEGFYPQPTSLAPACTVGETDYWILPFAVSDPNWLPADGRVVANSQYPEYGADYAGSAPTFSLPTVTAPPGMTALTCVHSEIKPEALLGQLDLFPDSPAGAETTWEPAGGQAVSEAKNRELNTLLSADEASGGKVPNLAPAGPGANWFIAATGSWPLT